MYTRENIPWSIEFFVKQIYASFVTKMHNELPISKNNNHC